MQLHISILLVNNKYLFIRYEMYCPAHTRNTNTLQYIRFHRSSALSIMTLCLVAIFSENTVLFRTIQIKISQSVYILS